ncbi:MAG: nucleoside-triphosphatase [Bacteroidota bacterium]
MREILIYSGPIKCGKTTQLMKWAASQMNIDGIFQPVIEGKRFLYHISSRTLKQLETDDDNNIFAIGNYKFLKDSFEWAKNVLRKSVKDQLDYLIIDEVGPLELDGKGLEPAITELLESKNNFSEKVIFVVRKSMLEKFIKHYHLETKYKMFEM